MPSRPLPILAALLVSACDTAAPARVQTPPDSAAGEMKFEMIGPGGAAMALPVHVNGQGPFRLILDTGATLTCLDRAVSRRLGLKEVRGVRGMGAGVAGSGQMRMLEVDSIRVGAAKAYDLTVCEVDLSHAGKIGIEADGLLGLNFLEEFRVTLDFERDVLVLEDPDGTGDESDAAKKKQ